MNSARLFRILLVAGWVLAFAAGAFFVVTGQWTQFGAFVAGLPAGWKAPGFRRAYLAHWLLPALAAYVILLCGSIFLGLRRMRKGAR
jgi:hypothetical protein